MTPANAIPAPADDQPLLAVRDLEMEFRLGGGLFRRHRQPIRAVDGVSFDIRRGTTLGLVGESGSGKSTTGRAILQLHRPTGGSVRYDGAEMVGASRDAIGAFRRRSQLVFQDPYSSLNPRMSVGNAIEEPMRVHRVRTGAAIRARVLELMELVGLRPDLAASYPHELSGGQRQRVCIARALSVEPEFIVCDEPVSALDVSIQAQIINLLEDLQARLGLTYLFIAHGLSVVRQISERVAVMYLGRIVEIGPVNDVFDAPLHPYTGALISASPVPDPVVERTRARIYLAGDPPSPRNPPPGCRFHPRCPVARPRCAQELPPLLPTAGKPDHAVACWFPGELARAAAPAGSGPGTITPSGAKP